MLSIKIKDRNTSIEGSIIFFPAIYEVDDPEIYIPAIDSEKKKRNLVASSNCLFEIDNIQNKIVKTRMVLRIADLKLSCEKLNVEIKLKSMDCNIS